LLPRDKKPATQQTASAYSHCAYSRRKLRWSGIGAVTAGPSCRPSASMTAKSISHGSMLSRLSAQQQQYSSTSVSTERRNHGVYR